ncbi:MAG: FAD-dependent oxidoreductase, partial [Deltaproteobacteria bacterium]
MRCGVQVRAIEGAHGRVTGVRLADDELVPADVVVVGVGVAPSVDWLDDSGLALCVR